jgi:hypothetical protein
VGKHLDHQIDITAPLSSFTSQILSFANAAVVAICGDWEELAAQIDRLVINEALLSDFVLNPDRLDEEMLEDDTYSKSRKYFRVVKAGDEFLESIETTENVFKDFLRSLHEGSTLLPKPKVSSENELNDATDLLRRLADIKSKFKVQQERAKSFQDGVSFLRSWVCLNSTAKATHSYSVPARLWKVENPRALALTRSYSRT